MLHVASFHSDHNSCNPSYVTASTAETSQSQLKSKSINPPIIFENTHYIFVVKTVQQYVVAQSKQIVIHSLGLLPIYLIL